MNFDDIIDRRGTHCAKWDKMEPLYGVPAETGIAMWVADMDFRPPAVVQAALQNMLGSRRIRLFWGMTANILARSSGGWKTVTAGKSCQSGSLPPMA